MNNFGIPLEEKHSDCDGIKRQDKDTAYRRGRGGKKDELQIQIDNCAQGRLKWGAETT